MTLPPNLLHAAATAILVFTVFSQPALSDAREERVRIALEVIRTTDSKDTVKAVVNGLLGQIKKLMIQAHPGRKDLIEKVLDDGADQMIERRSELHGQIAEVYADEFTAEELKELLKFYSGPLGKKFLTKMPLVTQKTIVLGQKWGRKVASDAIANIQTELAK